jgi:protein-disulfide isomerase
VDKRFLMILTVIVVVIGGLLIFTRHKAQAPSSSNIGQASDHTEGNNQKNVVLLEYGDFECSACALFHPIVKQVVNKYFDDIQFVFKEFPLDSIHQNARAAARAAEAASLQGQFWKMHDMLYENQDSWVGSSQPLSIFKTFASAIGLDINKFETDFGSEAVNATINADASEGQAKNIDGTPTYFLNGQKLENGQLQTVDAFSAKIEAAIQSASATPSPNSN